MFFEETCELSPPPCEVKLAFEQREFVGWPFIWNVVSKVGGGPAFGHGLNQGKGGVRFTMAGPWGWRRQRERQRHFGDVRKHGDEGRCRKKNMRRWRNMRINPSS